MCPHSRGRFREPRRHLSPPSPRASAMNSSDYTPSAGLRSLLRHFGAVDATLGYLLKVVKQEQPADRPGENYGLKDLAHLAEGEPALLVKISSDGKSRIFDADAGAGGEPRVTLMELPADDFWHFEAFRPAVSRLQLQLPNFQYEMALVSLCASFESFLSDVLRRRLEGDAELLRARRRKRFDRLLADLDFKAATRQLIELEVRDLMFLPLPGTLERLRNELCLRGEASEHEPGAQRLRLLRNCLLHAGGVADAKLSAYDPNLKEGDSIALDAEGVMNASFTLRKLAFALDQADARSPKAA